MNYRELPGENSSRLKTILTSPSLYYNYSGGEESDSLTLGSMIDVLILEGKESFEKRFTVINTSKPTATLLDVFNACYPNKEKIEEFVNRQEGDKYLLWSTTKDLQKRREKWDNQEFWNYWAEVAGAEGKQVVDLEEYNQALYCRNLFENDFAIQNLFRNKEIVFHPIIQFQYQEFNCKSELDIVLLDHVNKTIQEVDLKSSSKNRLGFQADIKKYRYDFQRAFYKIALENKYKDLLDQGWVILNSLIIYIPTSSNDNCFIFDFGDQYTSGYNWTDKYGSTIESVYSAFDRLTWHLNNNRWDYPREYYLEERIQVDL